MDVAFLPKPKVVRKPVGELGSALKTELERSGKPPAGSVMGARREYRLPPGPTAERLAGIDKIVADVKSVLDSAPKDSETRLGMNLSFSELSSGPSASGGGQARVSYQPRDVGNDMGLWVMGTGWTALVEEILTPPGERMPHDGNAAWWIVEGIGHASMGKSRQAAEAFERALQLDDRSELAYLGLGVARVISGDEKGAAEAYRQALSINPVNRAASEGLQWLLREPVLAPAEPAPSEPSAALPAPPQVQPAQIVPTKKAAPAKKPGKRTSPKKKEAKK